MTRLEHLRRSARMTREALATAAGVSRQTVWSLETTDAATASETTLWKLADTLTAALRERNDSAPAVDPDDLLSDAAAPSGVDGGKAAAA